MENRNISFIIPSYNAKNTINDLLNSIFMQEYDGKTEIIVVDDQSKDVTWEILEKRKEKNLRIFRNKKNSGFGYSVNRGIRLASYQTIGIIESDCIILSKNWLKKMMGILYRNTDVAVVSCGWRYSSDSLKALDFWGRLFFAWRGANEEEERGKKILEMRKIGMKGCLIKKKVFRNVGLLDFRSFRTGGEDVDLGMRLSKAGYKLLSVWGKAPILHRHGGGRIGIKGYLFKRMQYAEMKSVLLRKYGLSKLRSLKDIIFVPVKNMEIIYIVGLLFLITAPLRLIGISIFILSSLFVTIVVARKEKTKNVLLVFPVRLAGDILSAIFFIKGFIMGKQRL